jgi:hypothetical protein
MPTLNEVKFSALNDQGYVDGSLNEREYAWLLDQCEGGGGPPPSNDPNILWSGAEFTARNEGVGSNIISNLYFYEGSNGIPGTIPAPFDSTCGYYFPDDNTAAYQRTIADPASPFTPGVYIVKFDIVQVVSGDGVVELLYTSGREGEYWDLFRCDIRVVANGGGEENQEVLVDVTIATQLGGDENAGTATPVAGSEGVRRVRLISLATP